MNAERWMLLSEMARRSGIPSGTLRRWAASGQIVARKGIGARWYVDLRALKRSESEVTRSVWELVVTGESEPE